MSPVAALSCPRDNDLFRSHGAPAFAQVDAFLHVCHTARFHLHPSVKASSVQDGESILLRLGDGSGWRFRATGGVTNVQESVYLGERGR